MQHVTKAAAVTAVTDLGEFSAIAAAYSVDRQGDAIIYGAFEKSIAQWQGSGKSLPLHWNHSGEASDIIGSIDPASLKEIEGVGLHVSGRVDLSDSDTAKEAWRSMKNGSMSLSFGYMVVRASKREDGVQELHELDLFEVSIVPVPANPDTKILSMKSGEGVALVLEKLQGLADRLDRLEQSLQNKAVGTNATHSVDPLRQQTQKIALEIRSGGLSTNPPTSEGEERTPTPEPVFGPRELREHTRTLLVDALR